MVTVRPIVKAEPDYYQLAKTFLEMARLEIEAEAQAKRARSSRPTDQDAA